MSDHSPTDWQVKGVAVAGYTVAVLGKYSRVAEIKICDKAYIVHSCGLAQ